MKGGRDIRPLPLHSLYGYVNFLCPFLIISPTRFTCRGITTAVALSLCHFFTRSLCDSVCNKWSNISATFHSVGPNFFCVYLGKNVCLKKKFSAKGRGGRGQKMSDLSSFLSYLTRYRSKILIKRTPFEFGFCKRKS